MIIEGLKLIGQTVIELSISLLSNALSFYKTIEDAFSPVLTPFKIIVISITVISVLLITFCPKKKHK